MTQNESTFSWGDLLSKARRNVDEVELSRLCVEEDECVRAANGAVVAYTGAFTGRTPKDKFFVENEVTQDEIWWGGNQSISPENFERVRHVVVDYLAENKIYVVDVFAGADPNYRLKVRFIAERPYHALFVSRLFIQPTAEELASFEPDWIVTDAGKLLLEASENGTPRSAGILIDVKSREVLIAGTEYAGEMKKAIFTVMNFLLPLQGLMTMHCSANIGPEGDTALFFGLSGTGKTSLSADPNRSLIGDDEHGWSEDGVFNLEGGCYAKCINLRREYEPEIWNAIREGAVLENVVLDELGEPLYDDARLTENTRAAYPLSFIPNAVLPSVGGHPQNIVFLTCDALGLLPPISRLTEEQVQTYFLNGYTAKVAGTEAGVTEPTVTFSACFGQPFLPLHPMRYGRLLHDKIERHSAKVWLLNTGWTGGPYGLGSRIPISVTRAMLTAALDGDLDQVEYALHPIFHLRYPTSCPGVSAEVLDARSTWTNPGEYDSNAAKLQARFEENAEKYRASHL